MAKVITQSQTRGPRPRHTSPTVGRVVAAKTTAVVIGLAIATAAAAAGVTASLVVPDPGGTPAISPQLGGRRRDRSRRARRSGCRARRIDHVRVALDRR